MVRGLDATYFSKQVRCRYFRPHEYPAVRVSETFEDAILLITCSHICTIHYTPMGMLANQKVLLHCHLNSSMQRIRFAHFEGAADRLLRGMIPQNSYCESEMTHMVHELMLEPRSVVVVPVVLNEDRLLEIGEERHFHCRHGVREDLPLLS